MRKVVSIDPRLTIKKLEDVLDTPVIIRVNSFDEEACDEFEEKMSEAHESGQPIIPIVVDSYGGSGYGCMGMISSIENSKLPVATIVSTKAMSAGSILFAFGSEGHRYMDPYATLMIHDAASASYGKLQEMKSDIKELERLNKVIYKRMARHLGHPDDYFLNLIAKHKHVDWYLSSKDAKKHNIANHLHIPVMNIKIGVDIQFG
jgi:ATP-dependent protease ClpP protease subunit